MTQDMTKPETADEEVFHQKKVVLVGKGSAVFHVLFSVGHPCPIVVILHLLLQLSKEGKTTAIASLGKDIEEFTHC